jgi:membrane-associated protease RseP (regulator of RpoE activity)
MKIRLFTLALILATATALLADGPVKRTIVIRDGKVVSSTEGGPDVRFDGDVLRINEELFGGKRAYLGISLIDLSPELRDYYGAPKSSGLLVSSIEDDSPAAKAGVRVGDIIIGVDGKDVESSSDLRRNLRDKKEGDSVRVELLRGKARQTVVATVVERERPHMFMPREVPGLRELNSPEWRARIETLGDCGSLQTRIKDLETRLKDLEKKLQK